jgi:hypothetical protein
MKIVLTNEEVKAALIKAAESHTSQNCGSADEENSSLVVFGNDGEPVDITDFEFHAEFDV